MFIIPAILPECKAKRRISQKRLCFLKVWFTYSGQSCAVLLKIAIKVKAASLKKSKIFVCFCIPILDESNFIRYNY